MRALAFDPSAQAAGARCVRRALFEPRSLLPVAAACVVASAIRELLGQVLGSAPVLRLHEPVIPSARAWQAIAQGALVYRCRGANADAALVMRPRDARALVSAAFGEACDGVPEGEALSAIERDVLDRVAGTLAGSLGAVCGPRDGGAPLERVGSIAGFSTFFEVRLERPAEAAIGIALSREPKAEPHGCLTPEDLGDVELDLQVRAELGALTAAALARLRPGELLPLALPARLRGRLCADGRTLAGGTCGVRNGWYALALEGEKA